MSASDSPYSRHGDTTDRKEPKRVPLNGGERETIFLLAHTHLGDWREWYRVSRENELEDPLDLSGRRIDERPSFILPEGDDVTLDTGVGLRVLTSTPELGGDGTIVVHDTDHGVFELSFRAPGDDLAGTPIVVTEAEFFDEEFSITRRFTLPSYRDRHFLYFECDLDAFLVLWIPRETTVRLVSRAVRSEVLVPLPELSAGRGEL